MQRGKQSGLATGDRTQAEDEAGTGPRSRPEPESRRWTVTKIFGYFYNTMRLRANKLLPNHALKLLLAIAAVAFFLKVSSVPYIASLRVEQAAASPGEPLEELQYWRHQNRNEEDYENKFPMKPALSHRKYLTFEDDTGGWNNIRMAFEVFVLVAKTTGRILVVPPSCRFYLLDRGPVTTFKKSSGTVSTYADYYDLDDLGESVTILTTEEFLIRESEAIQVPSDVARSLDKPPVGNGQHTDYFLWLRTTPYTTIYPSGPLPLEGFFALSSEDRDRKLLHFPMHISKNYRYLSGVPRLLGPHKANSDFERASKIFLRQRLHYKMVIWKAASRIIQFLGGTKAYSALHIRRNDLQYKDVFIGAERSCENVSPQLKQGETLYLATDETEPDFFSAFTQAKMNYTVHTLRSIKAKKPDIFDFIGSKERQHKLEGMIEQAICAAARRFFGTPSSTYSSYIFRLRGYLFGESEESACRFHTKPNFAMTGQVRACDTTFASDASLWKL